MSSNFAAFRFLSFSSFSRSAFRFARRSVASLLTPLSFLLWTWYLVDAFASNEVVDCPAFPSSRLSGEAKDCECRLGVGVRNLCGALAGWTGEDSGNVLLFLGNQSSSMSRRLPSGRVQKFTGLPWVKIAYSNLAASAMLPDFPRSAALSTFARRQASEKIPGRRPGGRRPGIGDSADS